MANPRGLTEGEALKGMITQRLDAIEVEAEKVAARMPEIMVWQREKVQIRFEEAKVELDAGRFEQEMIMLAQKVDVAEPRIEHVRFKVYQHRHHTIGG